MKKHILIFDFMLAAIFIFSPISGHAEQSFMMTPDGVNLFYEHIEIAPEMEKGTVILLHGWGMSYTEWDGFKEKLNEAGWSTLAIEFRGHGASTEGHDRQYSYQEMVFPQQRAPLLIDVRTAVDYLMTEKPVWVVGSSIGANYALRYASQDTRIQGVILLAPGYDSWQILREDTVEKFGDRPLMLVGARNNPHSFRTCMNLKERAAGEKIFYELKSGHEKDGLKDKVQFAPLVINWMNTHSKWTEKISAAQIERNFLPVNISIVA